ncbi:MAG: branched-chain amino acid ABC transporter permease [Patescibacteria group bacterium]
MGYLFTQLARFSETAIMSMGAHLTIAVSGIFFLGIPVTFSLAAYSLVIAQSFGLPLAAALIISFGAVSIASFIFVLAYLKLSADSFTVFTLASILAFDAALKSWDSLTGGVLGIAGIMRPAFLSTLIKLAFFQFALAILALAVEQIILKTNLGRSMLAMKENKYLVESLGISSRRVGAIAIIISSFTAAIAGIVAVWRIQFLDPSFGGIMLLVQVVTIAIIAAKPKVRWLAFSTLIIVLLPEGLRFLNLPSSIIGHLRNLFYALILLVMIKNISEKLLSQKRFI